MITQNKAFTIPTSDGITLVAETFGAGPPLIAAHGLTGNRHMLHRQLRNLQDRYQIIVYDQRGHNDTTPVTDPGLYDPHRMAEDMRVVMDHLGFETAIVEGESMGAATTLLFAMKYPERVEKMLLTGPAFGDKLNQSREGLQEMADELRQYGRDDFLALSAKRMREIWNAPEEVIEAVQFMQGSHDIESLATANEAVKDWVLFDDLADIAILDMPVCIIAWPEDLLHPLDLAQRMSAIRRSCIP